MSNDAANIATEFLQRGVITVVPLTRSVENIASYQILLSNAVTGLPHDSKAQVEQVRALAFHRFLPKLKGGLLPKYLAQLDAALGLHFDL